MTLGAVGRRIVWAAVIGGVTGCWTAGSAGAASGDCVQVGRSVSCTFTYTGAEQPFTVPAGVTSVQIDAVGAPGGGSAGGFGGTASASVGVTPGQTLYVEVGGAGTGTAGGFNGGGGLGTGPVSSGEGGGGGASDVRTVSGALGSRLVVAAGGGGSGGAGNGSGGFARGGAAGADGDAGHAASGDTNNKGGGPGLAGTTTGGTHGAGGAADSGGTSGSPGTDGGPGAGGSAGGGNGGKGGGGGGGYFGGGGGGGGGDTLGAGNQAGGGGGGGGSCFALVPVACGADTTGASSVTLSYTLPDTTAPTISITAPGANAVYSLGAAVLASYSCADEAGGSGLASCQGSVSSGGALDTSTDGAHSFTVTAVDNAGNKATQTVAYTVVGTPAAPSISILSPVGHHTYKAEQRVRARYTCTEGAFGPGIKSCVGTVRSGGLINTQSLGRLKFTVTATSNDGQRTTKTIRYTVRAPKVVSSASYIVSIEGQQAKWLFTHLVSLNQPKVSCQHRGPLRVCENGKGKPASFTLSAPLTDDTSLLAWKKSAKKIQGARKTILLKEIIPTSILKSRSGTTIVSWRLTKAWPSKITVTSNRTTALVTVTFVGSALTRVNPQ